LNGVLGRESSGQSYLFWACLISQAKLQFAGIAATGGFTTAQVRATHLPTVLSLRPGMCVVLAGTNDFGNFSDATLFAAWQADMTAMYTALLANGTLPIAATLPATNNVGGTYTKLTQANVWITRTATRLGIPLVDFYGATTADNGNYAAGLNSDNVHPSAAGAKVMGTALWTLLQNVVPQSSVYISQDQPSIDTTRILSNELFLTDTNADGVPDNWSVTQAPTVGSRDRHSELRRSFRQGLDDHPHGGQLRALVVDVHGHARPQALVRDQVRHDRRRGGGRLDRPVPRAAEPVHVPGRPVQLARQGHRRTLALHHGGRGDDAVGAAVEPDQHYGPDPDGRHVEARPGDAG
jgi:lysophospholipase L1-like esterase